MISCEGGLIQIAGVGEAVYPTAAEIYSIVHEGNTDVRGHKVSPDEFSKLGIHFSRYAGEGCLELLPSLSSQHLGVRPVLYVKDGTEKILVPVLGSFFADYGCDCSRWIPLSPEISQGLHETIGDLSSDGTISFRKYLDVTARENRFVSVIDRMGETLAEKRDNLIPKKEVPKTFSGTLYPYQAIGFRWLSTMLTEGVPGCFLADEMGLGKTIQVICTLLACEEAGISPPHLVVSPATLLENWRREFQKFAPGIKPLIHRGAARSGMCEHLKSEPVVITSYDTLVSDISIFKCIDWGVLAIDEAQAIKNPDAKRTRTMKFLSRKCAIAITGTPVENTLSDLWSISDFLLPGRLGTRTEFQNHFPDTRDGAVALEPRVTPFILRRRVAEVATDLPQRIDIPQVIELDSQSAEVYDRIRNSAVAGNPGSLLATLTKLRTFCAHPFLVGEFRGKDFLQCSNKLVRLQEILEEVFSNGEKALVFTSFHEMSDLLTGFIGSHLDANCTQIDGRTAVTERQPVVDRFSTVKGPAALILNPRAAGTGLNIVAANHVIHYNLEWNPAIESQASARAFRRGQTRPVTVHRLFYSDTVEEFISDRAGQKRELADSSVVGTDGKELESSDIVAALKFNPFGK